MNFYELVTFLYLVVVSQTSCAVGLELCCPSFFSCGLSYPPIVGAPSPLEGQGQAEYGAFPWQVALLTLSNAYLGSGVLIDHMHVLTASHKVVNVELPFKVRFGEWDANNEIEPFPDVEINAVAVITHPRFKPSNMQYGLSVIRLASPAPLGVFPTITNICLPSTPIKPSRCWISG